MNLQVINRELCVNSLNIEAVASSSLLLIGDANIIQLASTFDTPAESLIIGPFVPLTPKG
ncbi:spore gernimation protein GerPD [Rossellomorea vietnamensis]|uniref:Spore gernimation protein GerPD n=2 Tax=Rossellomorea TaxID=2837508 RepID=A0A5D4KLR0_9BACI|nr:MULTISPECIES: spore gernimation protein GerPD [Rossellomorea]TYR77840.1 spore gernimation protein GerPD [Rossellomorea vietnamensis]TYS83330.1 spore gernimation protein GerPD [Rossellomorea aquimaris]